MKKTVLFIIVAVMILTATVTAYAAPSNLGIGFVPVTYTESNKIKIDGNINSSEWSETNSLLLSCKTNMVTWTTEYPGEIQFFCSWGNDGFYMAARIIDNTLTFTTLKADDPDDIGVYQDRFQIAFNPCGLIYDKAAGLFFSFYPVCTEGTTPAVGDIGEVQARKHNWQDGINDDQTRITEAGYKGAYKVTENGWDMEVILPWSLIATKDRVYDIIDYYTEAGFCSVFDPYSADRTKAFVEAMIMYVDNRWVDDTFPKTAKTLTADGDHDDWTTASHDIIFKFFKKGENTNNKTVTKYTVDELKTIFKNVDWSEWDKEHGMKPPTTSSQETQPPVTNPPVTNPPVTNPPATNPPVSDPYVTDAPVTYPAVTEGFIPEITTDDFATEDDEDTSDENIFEMDENEDEENDKYENKDDDEKNEESSSNKNIVIIIIAVVSIVLSAIAIIFSIVMAVAMMKRKKNG